MSRVFWGLNGVFEIQIFNGLQPWGVYDSDTPKKVNG